jgi:hypothetical protein
VSEGFDPPTIPKQRSGGSGPDYQTIRQGTTGVRIAKPIRSIFRIIESSSVLSRKTRNDSTKRLVFHPRWTK